MLLETHRKLTFQLMEVKRIHSHLLIQMIKVRMTTILIGTLVKIWRNVSWQKSVLSLMCSVDR